MVCSFIFEMVELMTRMSKQGERRAKSPRKRKAPSPKTGPKKDHLEFGFRVHENGIDGTLGRFNGKIRSVRK